MKVEILCQTLYYAERSPEILNSALKKLESNNVIERCVDQG